MKLNNLVFFSLAAHLVLGNPIPVVAAEVAIKTEVSEISCSAVISLTGTIVDGDEKKIGGLIASIEKKIKDRKWQCEPRYFLHLSSEGGSVEAAIKLGYIVRRYEMTVVVGKESLCASSCVFILAGGVTRLPNNRIGIHRPYFSHLEKGLDTQAVRKMRDSLHLAIEQFLKDMDVSPALLQAMLAIPPDEIRILSYEQLVSFRLIGMDATYEEKKTARAASDVGLTSSTYRARNALVEERCGNAFNAKFSTCRYSILLNLPESEVERRRDLILKFCRNYPIERRHEAERCYRQYLLGRN